MADLLCNNSRTCGCLGMRQGQWVQNNWVLRKGSVGSQGTGQSSPASLLCCPHCFCGPCQSGGLGSLGGCWGWRNVCSSAAARQILAILPVQLCGLMGMLGSKFPQTAASPRADTQLGILPQCSQLSRSFLSSWHQAGTGWPPSPSHAVPGPGTNKWQDVGPLSSGHCCQVRILHLPVSMATLQREAKNVCCWKGFLLAK